MDGIAGIPMAIISLLTSFVPLNRIERALIFADELENFFLWVDAIHHSIHIPLTLWSSTFAVNNLHNHMRWPWQPYWTMRQERKPCSKDSKAKERRRQVSADHEYAISALNRLLPDFFCVTEKKIILFVTVISDFFHQQLIASKLSPHRMFWEVLLLIN